MNLAGTQRMKKTDMADMLEQKFLAKAARSHSVNAMNASSQTSKEGTDTTTLVTLLKEG